MLKRMLAQNRENWVVHNSVVSSISLVLITVVSLTILCMAAPAHADSCKFPPVAVKEMQKIPVQRAVLVHRDGEERLIIESSVDGEGKEFAWVIPLPFAPSAFEATTSGLLDPLIVRRESTYEGDMW